MSVYATERPAFDLVVQRLAQLTEVLQQGAMPPPQPFAAYQ